MFHAVSLGQVLPQETIGVLVGAALPGVMGRGEVEAGRSGALDGPVAMELAAVVDGDRVDRARLDANQMPHAPVDLRSCAPRQPAEHDVAGLALDQAQHAGTRLAGAEHRVGFPMSHVTTCFDDGRACGDGSLVGQPAATVIASVAFAPLFSGTAQVRVEGSAGRLVGPDVAVDGLMADGQRALESKPSRDLLGTPVGLKKRLYPLPVCRTEASIPPGVGAPGAGIPVRELGAVPAIMMGGVTAQFSSHRASMASQNPSNRAAREPLLPKGSNGVSFTCGDLAVAHGRPSSLGRDERLPPARSSLLMSRAVVALTV